VSPLKSNGQLLIDGKSKAGALIDQFSEVFTRNNSETPVLKRNRHQLGDITITTQGVHTLLSDIKTSKAPGPDAIPNRVLNECATELAPVITDMFQHSIKTGTLPTDWRNTNITPVYKKGDTHLPENYRRVSLTSVLSKLLEHIVCRHLLQYLESQNILTGLNHGFRSE
jgi:hypothetical protein